MLQRLLTYCLFVVALGLVQVADGEEKPDAKATIAFRWLEQRPVEGLTAAKGIRTTCGDELSYPHLKPILTHRDVATAEAREHDLSRTGLPSPQFDVVLHLTSSALQKLSETTSDTGCRELAVFVDGEYMGTTFFRTSEVQEFVPVAGNTLSKSWAARVVAACRRDGD